MTERIIIAGGRDFIDYDFLLESCNSILWEKNHELIILSGASKGADMLGEAYAQAIGASIEKHPADWVKHGKSAGPKRNRLMAQDADTLICFWDGTSRGTKNMIQEAFLHRLETHVFFYSTV